MPDIEGRRVLDIGSGLGYDPFMFKLLGASGVMACRPFRFIQQMEFLESVYQSGIRPCQMRWQELDPELHGSFDLVHCHGVLYHEVHPMVLLERLRAMLVDDGTLLFGSMMLADPELSSARASCRAPTTTTPAGGGCRDGWRCAGCSRPPAWRSKRSLGSRPDRPASSRRSTAISVRGAGPATGAVST